MAIKSPLVRSIVETDRNTMEEIFTNKGKFYTYLNPVSYLMALKNLALFKAFDGLFADGSILVAAISLLYWKRVRRRSFDMTSMAPALFDYAEEHHSSVCVVASQQKQMEKAIAKFSIDYPNIQWVDCRNGYFAHHEEMSEAAKKIAQDQPDFLIAGMGAKMQEKFLLMCKEAGYKGIGFTCGGFIHQYAENKHMAYYPEFFDKWNLRFIYRFMVEKHTRKRYMIAAFAFPWKFACERVRYLFRAEE